VKVGEKGCSYSSKSLLLALKAYNYGSVYSRGIPTSNALPDADRRNKFIEFTEKAFGGIVKEKHVNDDQTIMHAQITIGVSVIMFSEARGEWKPIPGSLFIYVEDADESFKKAKDAGATVVMEPADQEYGRACGVKDPCDNTWWITSVKG
jgi:uncharacterized glyoxalase superfamily protein PhnB